MAVSVETDFAHVIGSASLTSVLQMDRLLSRSKDLQSSVYLW
jgi:hypothetical protein